jgi:hypothetical protein
MINVAFLKVVEILALEHGFGADYEDEGDTLVITEPHRELVIDPRTSVQEISDFFES